MLRSKLCVCERERWYTPSCLMSAKQTAWVTMTVGLFFCRHILGNMLDEFWTQASWLQACLPMRSITIYQQLSCRTWCSVKISYMLYSRNKICAVTHGMEVGSSGSYNTCDPEKQAANGEFVNIHQIEWHPLFYVKWGKVLRQHYEHGTQRNKQTYSFFELNFKLEESSPLFAIVKCGVISWKLCHGSFT